MQSTSPLSDSSTVAQLKNDTFLRALLRQPTPYTPVWLMRQAGRYLPEYRAVRKSAGSFLGLAKNPALAAEVTVQPTERYPVDAAIVFSDILTVPDAMGLGLHFVEGEGPKFERPLRDEAEIFSLRPPKDDSLDYVYEAIRQSRRALQGRVPLIGFSGSPWTLACYMVQGAGSKDYHVVKQMLYSRPDLIHHILQVNTLAIIDYLNAQIDAGAQAVMLFDSWGGILSGKAFEVFSLGYMRRVINGLTKIRNGQRIPSIVFTKGGGQWVEQIADLGSDAVGLDWTSSLGDARGKLGHKVALQGNLDPAVLLATPDKVIREARRVLDDFGLPENGVGHVFNLGHGISQFTPPENVLAMVTAVHEYSAMQRKQTKSKTDEEGVKNEQLI